MAIAPEERRASPSGPLLPLEMATAAVLGGVTVTLAIVGWILPHASAIQALGTVPMALLAQRHRPRAVLAAAVAGCAVSFLVAGTGPVYSVFVCSVIGGVVGDVRRRGRGVWTLAGATAMLAPALAGLADATLLLFTATRRLTLDQIRNVVHGLTGTAARYGALAGAAHAVDRLTVTALRDWWATFAVLVVVGVIIGVTMAWVLVGAVLDRLAWMTPDDRLEAPDDPRPVAPTPVELRDVGVRYAGASRDALAGVDLELGASGLIALVGANGSGKSTLARVLAGRAPTSGEVVRPGAAGLGRMGGTALVAQRPESQILGVRVADDVVWGLAPGAGVDVAGLLDAVGLGGMGDRDTGTLSGGELQRLAVAAALARQPRLLLSDESTAMLDPEGRRELVGLLASLPAQRPMTVVHVTHRPEEAAMADRIVHLAGGRVVDGDLDYLTTTASRPTLLPPLTPARSERGHPARGEPGRAPVLVAAQLSHTYAEGTPWAQVALRDVDLRVDEGEGLLIVGGNGSGKSTLAWALAGLLRPSGGSCLLDGEPVLDQVGAVALSFQHARLQLQRPTVGSDVRAASGIARDEVAAALSEVGLDADFAARSIDQLSGGEMRRVALAGLLAARPRVLLLDEPLAGLDPPSRRNLLEVLGRLRARGLTLVVISHDLEGMDGVCDRLVRLDHGRLTWSGALHTAPMDAEVQP
jgi:energy-coupling factor transport system ATP-binding protein